MEVHTADKLTDYKQTTNNKDRTTAKLYINKNFSTFLTFNFFFIVDKKALAARVINTHLPFSYKEKTSILA